MLKTTTKCIKTEMHIYYYFQTTNHTRIYLETIRPFIFRQSRSGYLVNTIPNKSKHLDNKKQWGGRNQNVWTLTHPPLGGGGGGRGRLRARLPPRPPRLRGGGGPRRGLMSSYSLLEGGMGLLPRTGGMRSNPPRTRMGKPPMGRLPLSSNNMVKPP